MTTVLTAAGLGNRDVRISDEIERLLRILSHLRGIVEAEVDEVSRTAAPGIPKGTLTQLKELTASMNSLTDAKVRLDKSAKAMAASMTPEEELAAVRAYIRALEPQRRMRFLDGEIKWNSENQL